MREGTAERRLVEDARDDEIVGWVIARTGPGAGILFLIAYLWGVAAVLGIVAIIAALAAIASPPLFSAAGMYGIATILTITLSAIPTGSNRPRGKLGHGRCAPPWAFASPSQNGARAQVPARRAHAHERADLPGHCGDTAAQFLPDL